jgi:hypothetical protein
MTADGQSQGGAQVYTQGGLLDLTTSSRCEKCARPLSNPDSRDRGYGRQCWDKTHTPPPRTPRPAEWTQTGPDLIDMEGRQVNVRTEITQYTISAAPEKRDRYFAITVDRRQTLDGSPYWVILHGGCYLGTDGTWSPGAVSAETKVAWLDSHEFDLETALTLAEAAAPNIDVNGVRARDAR